VLQPFFSCLQATLLIHYLVQPNIVLLPDIIPTLLVLDQLIVFWLAATEWNAAGLTGTDSFAAAVKINILVPVRWSFDATALQPTFLDPVDQVLLVRVVSVVDDECLETTGGLRLDPVLENEAQDAAGHLKQEKNGQKDGIGRQQGCVLPEGPHTSCESNDEGDSASPYEDEGRVEGDVGQFAQVVEGVLLRPRPDPDRQDSQSKEPKDDVEAKDDIFEAAGDLACVSDPSPPLLVLRVARRHCSSPSPSTHFTFSPLL